MRVADLNWMQVTSHLERDDRAVLPVGSTEQHAYLSLCTDSLLAERVAVEAAEPLGVPVFPALPYGITPSFLAYPGTVPLSVESFTRVIEEILDSLATGRRQPMVDLTRLRSLSQDEVREILGDGSIGGLYQRATTRWTSCGRSPSTRRGRSSRAAGPDRGTPRGHVAHEGGIRGAAS